MREQVIRGPVLIEVYRVTGRQLFFTVPERVCEECDLTVAVARSVVQRLGERVARVEVKPWLNHVLEALLRGGWHPPVVTVNGRVVSQGVVPDAESLERAVLRAQTG